MTYKFLLPIILMMLSTGCTQSIWIEPGNTNRTITYSEWTKVQAGVDFKQITVPTAGTLTELFDVVRIDPKKADVRIAVDQAIPKTVATWQEHLGATVVINASYFDENFQLLTRTITPTKSYGQVLSGKTGILSDSDNAWSIIPWQGNTIKATWAVQSYPMLVSQSQVAFTTGSSDTAQRTIIAQDSSGLLYFIVTEQGIFSLAQLSDVLTNQFPIALSEALNLDGGTSTGLVIHSTAVTYQENSLVVPSVIYLQP